MILSGTIPRGEKCGELRGVEGTLSKRSPSSDPATLPSHLPFHKQHHYLWITFPSLDNEACGKHSRKDSCFWDHVNGGRMALIANEKLSPGVCVWCLVIVPEPKHVPPAASQPEREQWSCVKFSKSTVHLISELLYLALNVCFAVQSSSNSLPTTENS